MILPKLTFVYDRRGRGSRTNPAVVELSVYADGKRKYISTGVKLFPREWSDGEVRACHKDYKELNEQLHAFRSKALLLINKMLKDGNLDLNALPSMMMDEMTQQETFTEYCRERYALTRKGLRNGTQKHYKVFFTFMEEWNKIVYFSDLTERNIMKMDEELERRGLKESSRYNYHKKLKMFIRLAIEDGLIKRNPYSRVCIGRGEDNGIERTLTPEEFKAFETCLIPVEKLRRVRDLFVFQTYTMMAYADMAAFDYKKCVVMNGQKVYRAKRKKTGQDFTVVLLPKVIAILKRYKYKLPIISNQKYNDELKVAILCAKVDKQISSHWARHTGATLLLNNGMDMEVIAKVLGDTVKQVRSTYAKMLDDTVVKAMVKVG